MRSVHFLSLLALCLCCGRSALAQESSAAQPIAAAKEIAAVAKADSAAAATADSLAAALPQVESDPSVKAATPGDETQHRIRAIRRNEQFYRSYGRPDLTKALVTGDFVPVMSAEIADLNAATLVGIVKGAADRFAMVEDGAGNGFILRVGDKVRNGRVTAITDNSVVGSISLYGMTSRVVLRLENKEGRDVHR
jgi:hypothetical protein